MEDFELFKKNELKSRDDTFTFDCAMCGDCCRNRREAILINGADIFRMAKALNVTMKEYIRKNTVGYLGSDSHVPVLVLKERPDGSCPMLRKGKCMVQSVKPAVCALFPLGRYHDVRDHSMHYFRNPYGCEGCKAKRVWTLGEWIDTFKLETTADMTTAWMDMLMGISKRTSRMKAENISEEMCVAMAAVLYFNYDTSRDFLEQVEENKADIQKVFQTKFGIKIEFE